MLCRQCARQKQATPAAQKPTADGTASNPGQKNDLMKIILIVAVIMVVGFIVLVIGTIVLSAVIAAFVFGTTDNVHHVANPAFTMTHSRDGSSYTITLQDMGGAKSIKGLWITKPDIDQPMLFDRDTDLFPGQYATFSVPGQTGTNHIIVMSNVDGQDMIVLDTYI